MIGKLGTLFIAVEKIKVEDEENVYNVNILLRQQLIDRPTSFFFSFFSLHSCYFSNYSLNPLSSGICILKYWRKHIAMRDMPLYSGFSLSICMFPGKAFQAKVVSEKYASNISVQLPFNVANL